jgi:hypothetical protein
MSMGVSRARLKAASKELQVHWDLVKAKWNDPVSAEFEKTFLHSMEQRVRAAASAMEKMEAVLAQARHDCE